MLELIPPKSSVSEYDANFSGVGSPAPGLLWDAATTLSEDATDLKGPAVVTPYLFDGRWDITIPPYEVIDCIRARFSRTRVFG